MHTARALWYNFSRQRNLHTETTRGSDLDMFDSPHGFTTACGHITFNCEPDEGNFSLDAQPGYRASAMGVVLGRLALWGFEALDVDEAEPQILPSGGVRIYCSRPARVVALPPTPRELEDCA